jgi:hypothetical protein
MAAAMNRGPPYAGEETLADLLADPIIDLVLKRDGLSRADLDKTIAFLRQLGARETKNRGE